MVLLLPQKRAVAKLTRKGSVLQEYPLSRGGSLPVSYFSHYSDHACEYLYIYQISWGWRIEGEYIYIYLEMRLSWNFWVFQKKWLFGENPGIFGSYEFIRSGFHGRIEVISRNFPNLGIRSGYVLFAFNLRSFCIQLHSGVKQIWYTHNISHGNGRKYPYPNIFSVHDRKYCDFLEITTFFPNT